MASPAPGIFAAVHGRSLRRIGDFYDHAIQFNELPLPGRREADFDLVMKKMYGNIIISGSQKTLTRVVWCV
jgi:hypothetical protein